MKHNIAIPLLVAALFTLSAAPAGSPQSMVERFYQTIHKSSAEVGGVPDAKLRAQLAPLVSPALAKMLEDADAAEARHTKATNNQEPPFVEGDLFSSLFEGPTSFSVSACESAAVVARCPVALTYVDARDKSSTQWTDDIMLVKTDTGWRVDDIIYGGTWDFGNKGRLTEVLKDVAREAE